MSKNKTVKAKQKTKEQNEKLEEVARLKKEVEKKIRELKRTHEQQKKEIIEDLEKLYPDISKKKKEEYRNMLDQVHTMDDVVIFNKYAERVKSEYLESVKKEENLKKRKANDTNENSIELL